LFNSIVFVHGITGDHESTWTRTENHVFWPKDLLPKEIANARIMTFGYDADIVKAFSITSSNTLRNHGQALMHDLAVIRKRTKSVRCMLKMNCV
jgi:hypothetical protein